MRVAVQKLDQIEKQRTVQQFRRLATHLNPSIQMVLPMAGIVGMLQEGLGHLLREAGLMLMMGDGRGGPARGRRALRADRPGPGQPVGQGAGILRCLWAEGADLSAAGTRPCLQGRILLSLPGG